MFGGVIAFPLQCWCEEKQGHTGFYRCFIAASYEAFYKRYNDLAAHARHCYEAIPTLQGLRPWVLRRPADSLCSALL